MGCLFIIPTIIRDVYMVCISEGRDLGAIVGFYPLSTFLIVIKWNSFVSSYGSRYLIFFVCFMNKFYEDKVVQSCLTLWDPVKCSPPDSSVHGILQARVLELLAISFSRGHSRPRYQTWVSCIAARFFTIWATQEANLFMTKYIYRKEFILAFEKLQF